MSEFGCYNLYDTSRLNSAYYVRGNLVDIRHWYLADLFRPPKIRVADLPGRVIKPYRYRSSKTGKPLWYIPALKCEYRKAERLNMQTNFDRAGLSVLVTKNGSYIKNCPGTVKELERMCRKKPACDYRIDLVGAFENLVYQRQGMNKWVLISAGKGYA